MMSSQSPLTPEGPLWLLWALHAYGIRTYMEVSTRTNKISKFEKMTQINIFDVENEKFAFSDKTLSFLM